MKLPLEHTNRRQFIRQAITAAAGSALTLWLPDAHGKTVYTPYDDTPQYRISVCDWMILKRQKLGAFDLAKDIASDGVEVDMGGLGNRETFDSKLGDPAIRQQFLDKSRDVNVAISSIAMSGFYAQSFAERDGVQRMVQDCIDTMKAMNVKIAFLPMGVKGDLIQYPNLRPAIVERLRSIAPEAEKAGIIIGIETALDAHGEAKLLDDVGSPAIRSYFNFANALQAGRSVEKELKVLGKDRICQIHCTNSDGVWLENDTHLDLKSVRKTLDRMHWHGWLVVERSRDAKDPRNVKWNFGANVKYLKSVFQS